MLKAFRSGCGNAPRELAHLMTGLGHVHGAVVPPLAHSTRDCYDRCFERLPQESYVEERRQIETYNSSLG